MAGNIKGITIEFRGDTTKLDKALREINNETKKLDTELKNVDKALKFNPTNVDLWKQKQEILNDKIQATKEKMDLLKDTLKKADAGEIELTTQEYRELQRQVIECDSKLKTFEGQLKKIGNVNLRATSEQFKVMGDKLTSAGQAMQGLSMAAAAVAASIGAVTVKSASWADDINTMSKKYSIATGELQKYAAASELVDVDVETIAKSHVKLEKTMLSASKGTGASAEAFEKLGVQVTDADGNLRDGDTVWQETISALGSMTNETERDALAMQLMGKSATELNPLIEDGGETYKNFAETLAKYDLDFVDEDMLNQANQFKDSLDTIKAVGLVAFQQLGTQLAAYLAPAMEKVVDVVGRLANWFSNLSPSTQALIAGIAVVVAVISPLLIGLGKISFAISSIMSLMATLGPAIGGIVAAFGPVILIIAAVVAAGVLLYKNWDTIKAKATALWTAIKTVFNGIKTSIINAWNNVKSKAISIVAGMVASVKNTIYQLKSTVTSVFNAIKTAITHPIQTAVNLVKGFINRIKEFFPVKVGKIFSGMKLPHFKVSGGVAPWGIGGKGSKPSISVDWYAKGGIFDSPHLIGIGEAGPEAVVPLDKLWDKLDNIAATSGAVVVNVYGSDNMSVNELAAAVEQRLIQMQKRRTLAWQ